VEAEDGVAVEEDGGDGVGEGGKGEGDEEEDGECGVDGVAEGIALAGVLEGGIDLGRAEFWGWPAGGAGEIGAEEGHYYSPESGSRFDFFRAMKRCFMRTPAATPPEQMRPRLPSRKPRLRRYCLRKAAGGESMMRVREPPGMS